jgi:hypothetical protein
MAELTVTTREEYKETIDKLYKIENFLEKTLEKIEKLILENYEKAKNGEFLTISSDGCLEIYFKECSPKLLICKVDIFNQNIVGMKLEDKDIKNLLTILKEKKKLIIEEVRKANHDVLKYEKRKFFFNKDKFNKLLFTSNALKEALGHLNDFIKFFEDRENLVIEFTSDIQSLINESEELNFIKLEKLFEFVE